MVDFQPGGKAILVFVYGTLKEGYSNHGFYLENAEFISYGKTKDRSLNMYDTGGYPVVLNWMKEGPEKGRVSGELYSIDEVTLAGLDRLEGNGSLFVRTFYDIELEDGSVVPAYMYTGVQAAWENRTTMSYLTPVTPDTMDGALCWRPHKKKAAA